MSKQEQQLNTESNLQTLQDEVFLTKQELEDFKKLPKEEQEKQKQNKLAKLSELHSKLDESIQEAIKTGDTEEAKKLENQLKREVKDLEQQIEITEHPEFPEEAIKMEITIGGKTKEELIKEMEKNKISISQIGKSMMNNPEFTISQKSEHINLVRISVKDLGFPKGATATEIYKKAQKLGLELCPVEVGPQLRLQYKDQPKGECVAVGMKPITNPGGSLVFLVWRNLKGELELGFGNVISDSHWDISTYFVFVCRKVICK